MTNTSSAQPFALAEAEPLIQTISKLSHVTVVKASPYFEISSPHICRLSDPKLDSLNAILWRFEGETQWWLVADAPRTCLIPANRIPGFDLRSFYRSSETPSEPGDSRSFGKLGVEAADLETFRASAIEDMPKLARYIEQTLGLEDKPSLGFEFLDTDLELPLMEDHGGPGGPVLLLADPMQYSKTKLMTSAFDRALHFWITDKEYQELWLEVSGGTDYDHPPDYLEYPLLRRIAGGTFETVTIDPGEVAALARESERLKESTNNTILPSAPERISSVCRSAMSYRLGIYIPRG